jgi:organic radical activating enzyme
MQKSKVIWNLSSYCTFDCVYCPGKFRNGEITQSTESYINAASLIQDAMYGHVDQINWSIRGGDPIAFPGISQLLKQIKSKQAGVEFHTSGGDNWFDMMEIADYIDSLKLTIHYWQNTSVSNFILDYFKEKQKKITINVPLQAGKILESREYVQELVAQGFNATEQILRDGNLLNYWEGYAQSDINLIEGRPADQDPVKYEVKDDIKQTAPVIPEATFVDLSKPPADNSPSLTGQTCYAGIDYMEIDSRGFVNGSKCRGRTMGNIFEPGWKPEYQPFACPMLFCRESFDRDNIRMGQ